MHSLIRLADANQIGSVMIVIFQNSPTLSQFKHNLIYIIRPPKRSAFGIHDVESLKLVTRSRVYPVTCMNIDFRTISGVIVHTVLETNGLRTTNTFSCTATDMGLLGGLPFTASLAPLTLALKLFVLVTSTCVICYCMVTLDSTYTPVVSS